MTPDEREKLLLRLCDDALSRDAGDRAVFLDEACGDDLVLRRDVESLLAGRAQAQGFLESQEWTAGAPPLTAGTCLGPYEIQSFVGAGGMGQVYKARDTRLGRTVAIKVLPPELAAHGDRRRRFEQEARAASALNDPHICTLYDIGTASVAGVGSALQGGTTPATIDYLVMEYLEGETLAARLRKGRLPLDQALDYATQIADALSKAHRQGIIHRDLKPGNVMLTKSGAKLLDFGLAKLRAPVGAAASASFTTREKSITAEGTLLGTVPYMAPEQLEGKEADARSDLFSFGTLLYEMLSGKRAFEGESHASVIAAILEHEPPPLSSLEPVTPPALDRLVRRCLAKLPDDRPDTAHDVADDLRWMREGNGAGAAATVPTPRRKVVHTGLIVVGVLVAAVIGAVAMWLFPPRRQAPETRRFSKSVAPAEDVGALTQNWFEPTAGGSRTALTWAPDGRSLVFIGRRNGVPQVYVLDLNGDEARPLENTEGARVATVSPDGKRVAFWAWYADLPPGERAKIRMVPFRGGPAVDIAPGGGISQPPVGFTWHAADHLLYAQFQVGAPILQIPVEGPPSQQPLVDRAKPVTPMAEAEDMHFMPWPLPSGRHLLITVRKGGFTWGEDEVVALTLATGQRRVLLRDADDARYVASMGATGHLVFLRRGVLFAVPFDPERLEILGKEAVVLTQTVAQALTGSP